MTTTIRTFPHEVVPGDNLYRFGFVLEVTDRPHFGDVLIHTEDGTEIFPRNYRYLYRIESA